MSVTITITIVSGGSNTTPIADPKYFISKRAKKALRKSVAKWQHAAKTGDTSRCGGAADCPLCNLYHPSLNDGNMREGCSPSCPIKLATGQDWCKGSPYEPWEDAFTEEEKEEIATAFARWLAKLEAESITPPRRIA